MKTSFRIAATSLMISMIGGSAIAQRVPVQRCEIYCGNPPKLLGRLTCPTDEFCCFAGSCVTDVFAGICCENEPKCCVSWINGDPSVDCSGPNCPPGGPA